MSTAARSMARRRAGSSTRCWSRRPTPRAGSGPTDVSSTRASSRPPPAIRGTSACSTGPATTTVTGVSSTGTGRLRLQPVEEAQAHTLGLLERLRLLERRPVDDTPVTVVVAGPVEHADVPRIAGRGREEARVDETSVGPEPALGVGRLLQHLVLEPARLLAIDLAAVDMDAQRVGLAVAIVLVLLGPGDHVTLAVRHTLQHEGVGEALHAVGPRL